jgi:peroxiredoxin
VATEPARAVDEETTRESSGAGASASVSRPRRILRGLIELAVVIGAYVALAAFQERHLLSTHTSAPGFELSTLDGQRVSLDSLRGKRVALHFWATWCGVCRREFGALGAVADGLGKDEALYAIVADSDDPERLRRFVAEEHLRYPVLLATAEVLAAFHVGAFPTTYYVNRDGTVGGHTVGMSTRYGIRARMRLLD